jgi:hypothetical protein
VFGYDFPMENLSRDTSSGTELISNTLPQSWAQLLEGRLSEFNPDPPRYVKLLAEIRKHKRSIKDSYNFHRIDELVSSLPIEMVEFMHECG